MRHDEVMHKHLWTAIFCLTCTLTLAACGDESGGTLTEGGDTSGSTSGDTSGSTSGDTSGSTSGDTSGSTSGDGTSGSTSGDTSGSTSGDTSGTSGDTDTSVGCDSDPCLNGGTCTDETDGSFTCACAAGYEGDTCATNTDDCAANPCVNGLCADGVDTFTCTCDAGYEGDTCATNIDDCAANNCVNGTCVDGLGDFTCACDAGYEGDTCDTDTDDCAANPCINGTCTDALGGFTCTCDAGYEGDTCDTDIDECATSADDCDPNALCDDTDGGFTCTCTGGYVGTGQSCALPTDCAAGPAVCDANATCTDTGTTSVCLCDTGYSGDGVTCTDTDGCAGSPCFAGVICSDVTAPGTGFSCGACPSGYTGDGITCTDNDECADIINPCLNNGSCQNNPGGFTCDCIPGTSGPTCNTVDATTCADLAGLTTTDGTYTIDPDGAGPILPISVFCDMTTDGGVGYTMLRIDDANLQFDQNAYAAACAAVGMEIIVPRTKAHARAIQAYNGGNPNIVNVFPQFNGAVGLSQWTGICQGQPCTFYMSDTDSAGCTNFEPNNDNNTFARIYRRSDDGGCFFGNWNDANNTVGIPGTVLCSPNDVGPAPTATCYDALSTEQIFNASDSGISGPYPLDPDGTSGPLGTITAYCDMTRDGGGWTLIGKVAAGNYTALSDTQYVDLIMNPTADVNPTLLTSAAAPAAGEVAFFNRPNTNALYEASAFGNVRVDMSNNLNNAAANGTYFQAKTNPPADWDFWAAMRDSRRWGTATSAEWVTDFGTDWILNYGAGVYDPATDTFPHNGDGTFGWWSLYTHTLNDGTTLEISRHFGLLCDGYGNQGWQWLLTADALDTRWKNDPSGQRTVIWIK